MGRKMVKYLFLAGLILLAGCKYHQEESSAFWRDSRDDEGRNCFDDGGLQMKITPSDPRMLTRELEIRISRDGRPVLRITQDVYATSFRYFSDAKCQKSVFYNIWGDRVAACIYKDDQPFSGSQLSVLAAPVINVEWSDIVTIRDGEFISLEPYAEKEVYDLFKQLEDNWFKYLPEKSKNQVMISQ